MSKLPLAGDLPLRNGEFKTWTATVRDDKGDLVGRFIVAFVVDTVGSPDDRVLRSGRLQEGEPG